MNQMTRPATGLDERLHGLFVDAFGEDYADRITIDARMEDIDVWDSVAFVGILLAIESTYGIKIGMGEAATMTDIATIQSIIDQKLTAAGAS